MALISDGYELLVTLVDRGNKTTTLTFKMTGTDNAGDISALITEQNAILVDLQAATKLKVKSYRLSRVGIESALTLPTDEGALRSIVAHLTLPIDGQPRESATWDLPGPEASVFAAATGTGSDQVIFSGAGSNPGMIAILNRMETGGSLSISDGEHIVGDVGQYRGVRATKKNTRKAT